MYRFFDKHGKKTLAVFGALLMLAFLLPSSGLHCGAASSQYGTIQGKPIDGREIENARARLQSLRQLIVTDARSGQQMTAWDRIFSFGNDPLLASQMDPRFATQLYQRINDNELTWLLLYHEAMEGYASANESEVDDFFSDRSKPQVITQERPSVVLQPLTNPPAIERLKQSVRMGLAIRDRFVRSMQNVKISTPMLNQSIAERTQLIKARLAVFSADDYLGQISEPTADELRVQFEAYAAIPRGSYASGSNPFGFGYRVPNMIRLQYLAVPESEVAAAVRKSKDDFAWEEEARVYFSKNWEEFVTVVTPPTTQTAQPATVPSKPTFESVNEKVFKAIRRPLIEQKRRAVVNLIIEQMNEDFAKASKNTGATTQPIGKTAVRDVAFGSYEYLLKIRDEVQRRHGVTVDVVNDADLVDDFQLRGKPGIGLATVEEIGPRNHTQSVTPYLFGAVKAFKPETEIGIGIGLLDLYQPTKPLWTADHTYVARVVEAVPSHAPTTLGEVQEQLVKDVRRKNAFAKAVEAADAAVAKAKVSGLSSLDQVVYTSAWFSKFHPQIPGAPITDPYADLLIEPTFELLRGLKAESELPRHAVIKAQRADRVLAVELFAAETRVSTKIEPMVQSEFRADLQMQELMTSGILNSWFSPDSVAKRVGFVRPDERGPQPESPAPAPARPFIPG